MYLRSVFGILVEMKSARLAGESFSSTSNLYRIALLGSLNPDWSDRLGGMAITRDRDHKGRVLTIPEGRLRGQSALSGVLVAVHQLHFKILQVELLRDCGWVIHPTRIPPEAN
jgi:hypothetical protein